MFLRRAIPGEGMSCGGWDHGMKTDGEKGFTLIELLVTVSIVAVVGAGVAVYYGREVVDNARRQMTLHEMDEIRVSFIRFYSDNASQLMDGLTVADSATELPADFASSSRFVASDSQTYRTPTESDPQRLYGMLEFFERYGLWPLLQKSVGDIASGVRKVQVFHAVSDGGKYEFKSSFAMTGEGWRGPYLSSPSRIDCVPNSSDGYLLEAVVPNGAERIRLGDGAAIPDSAVRFPQPATRYDDNNGGFYRVVYFEHCPDESAGRPVYRRLLLMAAEKPLDYDTEAEIARFRGNRRYDGSDAAPPIDLATGAVTTYDAAHGVFFLELLNFDTVYR